MREERELLQWIPQWCQSQKDAEKANMESVQCHNDGRCCFQDAEHVVAKANKIPRQDAIIGTIRCRGLGEANQRQSSFALIQTELGLDHVIH